MPAVDPSHVSWTRALAEKPDAVATTSAPACAAVGAMAIIGVAP
jgi:hypothetical protein